MAKKPASKQVAQPAGYQKHRAPKKWDEDVVRRTKRNPARFKPGLPLSYDELDMEYLTAEPIIGPDGEQTDKLWKEMPYIVGASQGELTIYLLFKLSGGFVHARPVSKGELRRWGVNIQ